MSQENNSEFGDAFGPRASGVPSEADTASPSLTPAIAKNTILIADDEGPHFVQRHRRSFGASTLLSLAAMLGGIGGAMGLPIIKGGSGISDPYRKRPNADNRPDRAKGMKAFDIDGVIIYAGTLKSARKKAKLLRAQGIVAATEGGSVSDDTREKPGPKDAPNSNK